MGNVELQQQHICHVRKLNQTQACKQLLIKQSQAPASIVVYVRSPHVRPLLIIALLPCLPVPNLACGFQAWTVQTAAVAFQEAPQKHGRDRSEKKNNDEGLFPRRVGENREPTEAVLSCRHEKAHMLDSLMWILVVMVRYRRDVFAYFVEPWIKAVECDCKS